MRDTEEVQVSLIPNNQSNKILEFTTGHWSQVDGGEGKEYTGIVGSLAVEAVYKPVEP